MKYRSRRYRSRLPALATLLLLSGSLLSSSVEGAALIAPRPIVPVIQPLFKPLMLKMPLFQVVCSAVTPSDTCGGGSGAAASVTPGTTTVTGATNAVLYADAASVLRASATTFGFDDTNGQISRTGSAFSLRNLQNSGTLALSTVNTTAGAGGTISIAGGVGTGASNGGSLLFNGGAGGASAGGGGAVFLQAGASNGAGLGGSVSSTAGNTATGSAGGASLVGGTATGAGTGGSIFLTAGGTTGGTAGKIQIIGGAGTTPIGAVELRTATPLSFFNTGNTFSATFLSGTHTANRTNTILSGTNLTQTLDSGAFAFGNNLLAPAGAAATPSHSFTADPATGFYQISSGNIGISLSNDTKVVFVSDEVRLQNTEAVGWSSGAPEASASDTGLARNAAGVVRATNGSTGIRGFMGGGAAVASAAALPIPTGRVFHVTGTTTVTSITSTNFESGAVITLIFDGVLTFTDGSNLVLAGNFSTTASDTITLAFDGTSWHETSRSVN